MELNVRISPNVSKRLKALQRGGGKAALAAEHAWAIINQVLEGISSPKRIGRLTRYGDARIPNCIKFDLVGGYRLIAVMGKRDIGFVFVGSHDECDHWIKNNAGWEAPAERIPILSRARRGKDETEPPCQLRGQEEGMEADDHDAELFNDLSDRDLRKIFCGLCGKHS